MRGLRCINDSIPRRKSIARSALSKVSIKRFSFHKKTFLDFNKKNQIKVIFFVLLTYQPFKFGQKAEHHFARIPHEAV